LTFDKLHYYLWFLNSAWKWLTISPELHGPYVLLDPDHRSKMWSAYRCSQKLRENLHQDTLLVCRSPQGPILCPLTLWIGYGLKTQLRTFQTSEEYHCAKFHRDWYHRWISIDNTQHTRTHIAFWILDKYLAKGKIIMVLWFTLFQKWKKYFT